MDQPIRERDLSSGDALALGLELGCGCAAELSAIMNFDLILFYRDAPFTQAAVEAGIRTVIVDWERGDKRERQQSFDTQISTQTAKDLHGARESTTARLICRLNRFGSWTESEVITAIEYGADEILLPMVRSLEQVEVVLEYTRGQCALGIMIETIDALEISSSFAQFSLARAYVGLNDLHIERDSRHIFTALEDGTVESVKQSIPSIPFGFGGLTLPDRGEPLPCSLIIAEIARLECSFSFLRRSFYRDIEGGELSVELPRLRAALGAAQQRSSGQIERDQLALLQAIGQLPDPPWREL
jgi:hypothetical protein